jgi:PEGA domain-containing protein
MKRIFILLSLTAPLLFFTPGCVEQILTVNTNPKGALVELNGQELGRTPVTKHFTWYGTYEVILRADGYQTQKTTASVIAPWYQWVPFDIVFQLLPIPLKDHHVVKYDLIPTPPSSEPTPGILNRATQLKSQLESTHYPTTQKSP